MSDAIMAAVKKGGRLVVLNVHAAKRFRYRRDERLGEQVKNIIPEGCANG